MLELLLIASAQSGPSYQHITPQNLNKVRQTMSANKKTSEQTITGILGVSAKCNEEQSYYKVCNWEERVGRTRRNIGIEWRKGIFYRIYLDGF